MALLDPYVDKDTNVLKNKLGIKESKVLEKIESDIVTLRLIDVDEKVKPVNGFNFEHIQNIHKYLFGDIFDWAGQPRTVNIYKSERVLNGLSVDYSMYKNIKKDMKKALNEINSIDWSKLSDEQKISAFTKCIARIWQVHPFREGNTRTILAFAAQFAQEKGFKIDKETLTYYKGHFRDSLVMASIGAYSEYKYLENIFKTALTNQRIKYQQKPSLNDRIKNCCMKSHCANLNKSYKNKELER